MKWQAKNGKDHMSRRYMIYNIQPKGVQIGLSCAMFRNRDPPWTLGRNGVFELCQWLKHFWDEEEWNDGLSYPLCVTICVYHVEESQDRTELALRCSPMQACWPFTAKGLQNALQSSGLDGTCFGVSTESGAGLEWPNWKSPTFHQRPWFHQL